MAKKQSSKQKRQTSKKQFVELQIFELGIRDELRHKIEQNPKKGKRMQHKAKGSLLLLLLLLLLLMLMMMMILLLMMM